MMIHLHLFGQKFKLDLYISKIAYIAYLIFGGVFIEPDMNITIKMYFILMQTWLILSSIAGPTLYILLHRHELSSTSLLYLGITVNGDLALCLGQLIFLFYSEEIKIAIKSMDDEYPEYIPNREAIDVRRLLWPLVMISLCGIFGFLLPRPIEFTFARADETTKDIFYNLAPLPIDLQCCFNVTYTRTYWINTCLIICPLFYILLITAVALLTVTIIPLSLYNRFIHLFALFKTETRWGYGDEKMDFYAYSWRYDGLIECYQKLRR